MKKGCWVGLTVVGAFGMASIYGAVRFFTTYYDFGAASRELPNAVADYQSKGLPFVASDLFPKSISDSENAAPAVRSAIKALPGSKVDHELGIAMKTPGPAADPIIERYKQALSLVDAVANRPYVDFKRDWDLGPYLLFPEYSDIRALAKSAVYRAVRSAQKGNDEGALRDLTLAQQLGVWAGQEPTVISFLVRIAVESIALNGVEQCVVTAAARPERIEKYARWLTKQPNPPDFGNALRGEAYTGVVANRNLDRFGGFNALASMGSGESAPKIDPGQILRSGLPVDGKQRAFLTRHLQVWSEAYRTTDGFRKSASAIGDRLDQIAARLETEKGLSYTLERILLPVFSQAGLAATTVEARRAVQKGFAEAMIAHARTGNWPSQVTALDPFTGKLLHVKRDGAGIRIYSVGKDKKDDGGFLKGELKKLGKSGEDLVAAYPAIPK